MKLNFSDLPQIEFLRPGFGRDLFDAAADTETRLIILEAERLGVLWRVVPHSDVIELKYRKHVEFLRRRSPASNHSPGSRICSDKGTTRAMLEEAGIPVPRGVVLRKEDGREIWGKAFSYLKPPLVVKPAHGTHGAQVFVGIDDKKKYEECVSEIFETVENNTELSSGGVVVEEMVQGLEYRIIATCNRVVAVMYREPASVVGDGVLSIAQLIELKNQDPMRNLSQDMYPRIVVDFDVKRVLKEQGYRMGSVPALGEKVWLRRVSNIMAGGDAYDVTDQVHPSVCALAVETICAIPGLTFGGIDFMTQDITINQSQAQKAVIEVNSAPEFAMHDFPMHGVSRGVALEVIYLMFPELREDNVVKLRHKN